MKHLKLYLPAFIKPFIRFIYYPQERRKFFREIDIRKRQNEHIKKYDPSANKIIIFLVPGADYDSGRDNISGGVISIVSLCEESDKLKNLHGAEVIMATFPNQHLLLKHTQFNNHTNIFRFSQIQSYFKESEDILFHLPEYMSDYFIQKIKIKEEKWFRKIKEKNINILNQNIRLMPPLKTIEFLKQKFNSVSISTAHEKYCNREFRDFYGVPLHKFSVWISPEQYSFKKWDEKENIIVVSPDENTFRAEIINSLKDIKGLKVQVIQNLTHEDYKLLISKAKWSLTFGEGLDGYFIEPIFSGAISFAVYNEKFFTSDFSDLQTVYPDYDSLRQNITKDIERLNNADLYAAYQKVEYDLCAIYYNKKQYINNIASFYKKDYTYA